MPRFDRHFSRSKHAEVIAEAVAQAETQFGLRQGKNRRENGPARPEVADFDCEADAGPVIRGGFTPKPTWHVQSRDGPAALRSLSRKRDAESWKE